MIASKTKLIILGVSPTLLEGGFYSSKQKDKKPIENTNFCWPPLKPFPTVLLRCSQDFKMSHEKKNGGTRSIVFIRCLTGILIMVY